MGDLVGDLVGASVARKAVEIKLGNQARKARFVSEIKLGKLAHRRRNH